MALTEDTSFPEDAQLFLVFEGANRRHVTTASKVSVSTLHSFIPGKAPHSSTYSTESVHMQDKKASK